MCHQITPSICSPLPSSGYPGRPLREPWGSPPSQVLWVRKTARLSIAAASGYPWRRLTSVRARSLLWARPPVPQTRFHFLMRETFAQSSEEIASSPGFTGDPFESMPRSWTPATPAALALAGDQILPSSYRTLSAFAMGNYLGAHSSRPASSLHTLRRLPVTRQTAMLASRLPATALAGRDFHPLGLNRKFHCFVYSSSFSALCPARSIKFRPLTPRFP